MIRTVIGGLVGGIIMFVIGFIFWASAARRDSPSPRPATRRRAAVQTALAQNLTPHGTGTYVIPDPPDAARAPTLYAQRADRDASISTRPASRRDDMSDAAARLHPRASSPGC